MIRKPATFILLLAGLCISKSSVCQLTDSIVQPLSRWTLRVNPVSFFEEHGGVHLGLETNVGTRGKFYVVSEYGYNFINNQDVQGTGQEKNKNKLSGFETKQELKMVLGSSPLRINSMAGLEINLQRASIKNAGWFGMGNKGSDGLYPYFKYQSFKEQLTQVSVALKYILKAYPLRKYNNHLEFFGGLGVVYKKLAINDAAGELLQPDAVLLWEDSGKAYDLYLAGGCRLMFRLK